MNRINEIEARLSAITAEIATADATKLGELETEVNALKDERSAIVADAEKRKALLDGITTGAVPATIIDTPAAEEKREKKLTDIEKRAADFVATNKKEVEARSLLTSTTGIAKPTQVQQEINDAYGTEVSSLVDMITVTDCTGMATYRIPIMTDGLDADAATEGTAPTAGDITVSYVDLTPSTYNVLSYVSKEIKKQTPVVYDMKVVQAARTALRKKASKVIVDAIYAQVKTDGLCTVKEYAKDATNGVKIDATTLRSIVFAYGGTEGVGNGTLVLNKTDLIAFGDVRGTNEKKAVYEITPDANNENTGIIKDGGLSVRYVINSNCTAFAGNKEASQKTMIYGNLKYAEMGTWGNAEITTSTEYKFAEGLLAVLGEASLDVDVNAKNGFLVVTIGA